MDPNFLCPSEVKFGPALQNGFQTKDPEFQTKDPGVGGEGGGGGGGGSWG